MSVPIRKQSSRWQGLIFFLLLVTADPETSPITREAAERLLLDLARVTPGGKA